MRERKKHTARHIASTPSVVLTGGGTLGGGPDWTGGTLGGAPGRGGGTLGRCDQTENITFPILRMRLVKTKNSSTSRNTHAHTHAHTYRQ